MNSEPNSYKQAICDFSAVKTLIDKLKKLSKKLCSLGYAKQEIGQIILGTFLDLPIAIDWFDLQNTDLLYSLKSKVEFDIEDSELIMIIAKCFIVNPKQKEELAQKLITKLIFACQMLGFDLDNQESGSSQDSSTLIKMYKLRQSNKKQSRQVNGKKNNSRSRSRPPPRKKANLEDVRQKKKNVRQQQMLVHPSLQKKHKTQQ